MTKIEDFFQEQFTQEEINKFLCRARWETLVTLAIEMGFNIQRMSTLKYDYIELRNLMVQTWREKAASHNQCRKAYKRMQKENEKQRQVVMSFHLEGEN